MIALRNANTYGGSCRWGIRDFLANHSWVWYWSGCGGRLEVEGAVTMKDLETVNGGARILAVAQVVHAAKLRL